MLKALKKIFGVSILFWVLLVPPGEAFSATVPKTATSLYDPIVWGDTDTYSVPFTRAGNLILIQAKAGDISGNFILDTGSPHLVLNLTYFRDYRPDGSTESAGITGGIANVLQTTINDFSLGVFQYKNVDADIINLGHLENVKGVKILGLIGVDLLTSFTIMIDYPNNMIHFRLLKKKDDYSFPDKNSATSSKYQTIKFRLVEDKIVTTAEMSGKKLNFIIDTGAESNVLDSRLPNTVLDKVSIQNRVTLNGSGTSKVEAVSGEIQSVLLGGMSVQHLPVIITNLEKMCTANNFCIDGMLGFDFLSLHRVEFNFAKREMYVWN